MEVAFENIRQAERITEDILPLKELMEHRFNLSRQVNGGNTACVHLKQGNASLSDCKS